MLSKKYLKYWRASCSEGNISGGILTVRSGLVCFGRGKSASYSSTAWVVAKFFLCSVMYGAAGRQKTKSQVYIASDKQLKLTDSGMINIELS